MDTTILLCLALILIILQTISLFIVWIKKKKLQNNASLTLKSGNLALTKKQLYREIERHQETEISLKETQTYLQALIDSMPSILIGVSVDGTVTHWNKSAENASGLKLNDVFGKELQSVFPSLPVNMSLIEKTLASGQPQYKKNIQQGHGSNARYTDLVVYPLFISQEVEEAVVMATDVSQRVHIENRLMQSDKMQGLGEMAAGLAHEINNPLAGILHHVQNVKRRTSLTLAANRECAQSLGLQMEDIHRYLYERNILSFIDNIKIAGERASQIVNNMLNFARSSPVTFVETDLLELIEHSIELAVNSFKQSTQSQINFPVIIRELPEKLALVECAPIEIQQVLINLLRNAVQSFDSDEFDKRRKAEIRLRAQQTDNALVVQVVDNGPGISADVRKHIFDPFFTTKPVGDGTGLGLSVCYFIVSEHHNGEIIVESEPGVGTCFSLTLPLVHTAHSDKSADSLVAPQQQQPEYPQQI